jgi:hypothetical protein
LNTMHELSRARTIMWEIRRGTTAEDPQIMARCGQLNQTINDLKSSITL